MNRWNNKYRMRCSMRLRERNMIWWLNEYGSMGGPLRNGQQWRVNWMWASCYCSQGPTSRPKTRCEDCRHLNRMRWDKMDKMKNGSAMVAWVNDMNEIWSVNRWDNKYRMSCSMGLWERNMVFFLKSVSVLISVLSIIFVYILLIALLPFFLKSDEIK